MQLQILTGFTVIKLAPYGDTNKINHTARRNNPKRKCHVTKPQCQCTRLSLVNILRVI